ncbi:MAG TPA: hypothetical protein VFL66_03295 [Gaiellaceae bacterium]|nr:hypothetical protein [Gaiellaceae bacterium]
MASYDALADLPLRIEEVALDGLALELAQWTRRTTVVRLRGGGEEGTGEDVTYDGDAQLELQRAGPGLELAGEHTLDSFVRLVDDLPGYRPWAFGSAALDLALRQAGRPLHELLGREPRPVRYVVSTRAASLRPYIDLYPGIRFKLDPTPAWTDAFCAELAGLGRVDVVDLKGHYSGTSVDNPPDAALYRRVAEAFPEAWIEDPALTGETAPVLEPHRARLTWDAPIHSVADVDALPFPPRCLNSKPSRFGSLRRLFDFYDVCAERGIALYGGGQFELGPGRGQIQYLASLFHPDGPNDVAPGAFNEPVPRGGLPASPLEPTPTATGFRF